ncbi:MAG: 2-phosphosulfolactate phosphatase [Bacteroidales bacterium]|nr:2-phosphosulfolactate phosphatase [Bacteroidales bacterium]
MKKINVCLSPALYQFYAENNTIVVMIDAIRASASICTAFMNGVKFIVPVSEIETALSYKKLNYIIAGERNGKKLNGFDFGNSPFNFTEEKIKGEKLAFTTTNGTQAVNLVKNDKHKNTELIIGSFINISALTEYLIKKNKNILILCSAWKNTVNIEDTLFAGRLAHLLLQKQKFETPEATNLALNIYKNSGNSYFNFVINNSPRLKSKLHFLEKDIKYCLTEDITDVVPFLKNNELHI